MAAGDPKLTTIPKTGHMSGPKGGHSSRTMGGTQKDGSVAAFGASRSGATNPNQAP